MKIKHQLTGYAAAIIELEPGEILHIQNTVKEKSLSYRVGKTNTDTYSQVILTVEDNLFIVKATKNNKVEQKLFSDIWGFYIDKD